MDAVTLRGIAVNRHDYALLLLTLGLLPLLYVSLWFAIAIGLAGHILVARLADRDLDRLSRLRKRAIGTPRKP